jgi:uncharacterized membrane protein
MFAIIDNTSVIENTPLLMGNLIWMSWNIFLALIGLGFGWLMSKYAKTIYKWFFFFPWLLFIPNSIYVLTDIIHLVVDWPLADFWIKVGLFGEYLLLFSTGLIIYYLSLKLFEKTFLQRHKLKGQYYSIIIGLSILFSFGVFMGRVQRSNSWHVLTKPVKIIQDSWFVLSNFRLMIITILFGLASAGFYLLCRDIDINYLQRKKLGRSGKKKRGNLHMVNVLR